MKNKQFYHLLGGFLSLMLLASMTVHSNSLSSPHSSSNSDEVKASDCNSVPCHAEVINTAPEDLEVLPRFAPQHRVRRSALIADAKPYQNQCLAAFANGVQSHTAGPIEFWLNARVTDPSSTTLHASSVTGSGWSVYYNCYHGWCNVDGQPSVSLPLADFQYSSSDSYQRLSNSAKYTFKRNDYGEINATYYNELYFEPANDIARIKKLTVNGSSKLIMKPGDYWVENLSFGSSSKLEVKGEGTVRLFVKNTLNVGSKASLNYWGKPENLLIIGWDSINFSSESGTSGFVYARGTVPINFNSHIYGAVAASYIRVKTSSGVHYRANALKNLDFGSICDLDNDGIYDGKDSDVDGDNITNDDEILAGSDPYNPNDIPQDMDNDGVFDGKDNDIDGDNVTNEDEIAAGTNPRDPNDFPDSIVPIIELTGATERTVNTSIITIAGKVTDSGSGVKSVWLVKHNNHDTQIYPELDENGVFNLELPLQPGLNEFTLWAKDNKDNQSSVQLAFSFQSMLKLGNISPESGSILNNKEVGITGYFETSITDLNQITAQLAGKQLALVTGIKPNTVQFSTTLQLNHGYNALDLNIVTAAQSINQTITYKYQPDDLSGILPPKINLLSPGKSSFITDNKVTLYGRITSKVGGLTATLNSNDPIQLTKVTGDEYLFRQQVTVPEQEKVEYQLLVTDALGLSSTEIITLFQDFTEPTIILPATLKSGSSVNIVNTERYLLAGEVTDNNIRSFTINGNPVALLPAGDNRFLFESLIQLPANEPFRVSLEAKDASGYKDKKTILFKANNPLNMQWVSPSFPYQWIIGETDQLTVLAAVTNSSNSEEYTAQLTDANGQQRLLGITQEGALLSIAIPELENVGQYRLTVTAKHSSNTVIGELVGTINAVSQSVAPLSISQITPQNGAKHIEPDSFISLQFNQPIKNKDISIEVRQTAHGLTYINTNNLHKSDKDVQFLFAKGQQLKRVDLDQAPVSYQPSSLPGKHALAFYSKETLSYNAQVFVTVKYKGEELYRSTFFTRSLPTFIEGGVVNAIGKSQAGVEVLIKELGRKTLTNKDGAFAFGFGDTATLAIKGGRYTLVVNPNHKVQTLGSVDIPVSIEEGRRNQLKLLQVPSLQPSIPYQYIPYGKSKISLAQGALNFDLGNGQLIFPENQERRIHTQFVPGNGIVRPIHPLTGPSWVYQLQPAGITATGPIKIAMDLPKFQGSYQYLPDTAEGPYYVMLVGYNDEKNIISPVGVAEINQQKLTTLENKPVTFDRLDYIGFYMPPVSKQAVFKEYVNGNIGLELLIAELNE
ncbi:hypothetical protein H0A36_06200 [Endozoicomonas sp. SM1973]|uniref:DUF7305 domain-containing protein n=1 Tax=Spartinivicinus marinus TaxID=2994442 RepID=A0A853I7R0_9GAMM|nr:thrombospondin type 3 repeat-containing protein [Spartinivicinus marinus]MCX4028262.1 thrombospondin type 3 repeat-containing protein [Spartinivicinus marinus]NYZ65597.1 hypothetical protein [Spartinivicinus marinus]